MTFPRIVIPLYLLPEHDLFRKPVTTFRDHALNRGVSPDQGVEPRPHGLEVEPEPAIGKHHDRVMIVEVVTVIGAKAAPISGMSEPLDATRAVHEQRPA